MPRKEYQRLTRARSRTTFSVLAASRSSLWLGKDHLLCIDSSGYTESYKRFYYRDIQAIFIVANKRRAAWNAVLAVPLAICLAGLANALFSLPGKGGAVIIVWLIFLGIFALLLAINSLLGPGCTGYLRTAVQTEELPSLSRVPRAGKALDRLRPLIAAAQGNQPAPEELATRMQTLVETVAGVSPAAPAPSPGAEHPGLPPRPG
jgi:hypothetical protein